MTTISVIVPAHNNAHTIIETLNSVQLALQYFYTRTPDFPVDATEVLVVDDDSADGTCDRILEFAARFPNTQLIRASGHSAASSRNSGVAASRGDILFFLDGDDLYFPDHIHLCFQALNFNKCGYIRSLIYMSDPVHPDWYDAIANSSMINLCVRRDCHEFLGGVPDLHLVNRRSEHFEPVINLCPRNEDVYYNDILTTFFHGYRVCQETVQYLRFPGNSLDRQYTKFCKPWGTFVEEDTAEEALRKHIAELAMHRVKLDLFKKRSLLGSSTALPFKV